VAEIELGWRAVITDPERRAAIAAIIVEIVHAVEAWHREQPPQGDSETDYAVLRVYAATDDTVPDPDDEGGKALAAAIAAIAERASRSPSGTSARATTPTWRAR
jgi:hypothetical protein